MGLLTVRTRLYGLWPSFTDSQTTKKPPEISGGCFPFSSSHAYGRRLLDRDWRQPAEAVFGGSVHNAIKLFADGLRDWAGNAATDGDLVHGADRCDLGCGPTEEQFVADVQHLARNNLLDDWNAEFVRDVQHRVASDAGQNAVAQRRRVDAVLMHDEDVLAGSLADVAVDVQRDALGIAVHDGFHLDQLRIHVVGAGFGHGRHGVGRQAVPGRNADLHAVVRIGRAEVLTPLVVGNVNLGGRVERIDADLAITAQHDWADVTRRHFIGGDEFHRPLAKLVERIVQFDAIDLARLDQTTHMVLQAEDSRALWRVVATDSLEHR